MAGRICQTSSPSIAASAKCRSFQFLPPHVSPCRTQTSSQRFHHGIPADLHRPAFEPGSYLAFLGRISPEKRPDRAIRIAQRVGIPLKIAAKVDKVDEAYFRTEILPLVDGKGAEFL